MTVKRVGIVGSGIMGSGITDQEYKDAGAKIATGNAECFSRAQMIVKVKEPIREEYNMVRKDQVVFTSSSTFLPKPFSVDELVAAVRNGIGADA